MKPIKYEGGDTLPMNIVEYVFNEMKGKHDITDVLESFSEQTVDEIYAFQRSHPKYTKTPLVQLSNLSEKIRLGNVYVKDESKRFGLNAFKVLGGIYVVGKYIAEKLDLPFANLTIDKLLSKEVKERTGTLTFASATDGNHGRGIAWAARELGHEAVIYLPKGAAKERVEAIENEGAKAVVTDVNYDDTVRLISEHAEENNWVLVQDTAWEGYEDIPHWIMQGYATLTKEIYEQLNGDRPTHVFLQAGVGSYAAAVVSSFKKLYGKETPKFLLVEPHEANCYYHSFIANDFGYRTVAGDLDTIMAGLSCGEPSPQAWEILRNEIDTSFSCDDVISALGMRILGNPLGTDERIVSGEAGSVTTGLLYTLMTDPKLADVREGLQLTAGAKVVLINTEGDTDKKNYREVVWQGSYPLNE